MITTTYIPIFFNDYAIYIPHLPNVSVLDIGLNFDFKQQIGVTVPILYTPVEAFYPIIYGIGPVPVTIPYLNITFEVDLCFFIQEALYRPRTLGVGFHFSF